MFVVLLVFLCRIFVVIFFFRSALSRLPPLPLLHTHTAPHAFVSALSLPSSCPLPLSSHHHRVTHTPRFRRALGGAAGASLAPLAQQIRPGMDLCDPLPTFHDTARGRVAALHLRSRTFCLRQSHKCVPSHFASRRCQLAPRHDSHPCGSFSGFLMCVRTEWDPSYERV